MIPVCIIIAFLFYNVVVAIERNGRPKEGHYDAGLTVVATLIVIALYYWAGLFDVFFS